MWKKIIDKLNWIKRRKEREERINQLLESCRQNTKEVQKFSEEFLHTIDELIVFIKADKDKKI